MAKKHRPKKQEQAEIAEAVAQQQQRLKLKRQIKTMKRLPKDFRDITLGTDWEAFADITGRREEMRNWWDGPVLYLAPLNHNEKMILGSPNKLVAAQMFSRETLAEKTVELTASNWIKLIRYAEDKGCSWIYLPDEEPVIVDSFNRLFSRFGFNIRVKGQLMSDITGKPVGVAY